MKIKIKGFDTYLTRVTKAPITLKNVTNEVMKEGMTEVANRSDARMPNDLKLEGGSTWVTKSFDSYIKYVIFVNRNHAAYYEFGTGTKDTVKVGIPADIYLASMPQNWVEYAANFLGKSFPYTGTIPAQPFIYPTIQEITPHIFSEIKLAIKNL